MDIRTVNTENRICNAFLYLRARNPIEDISVEELCSIARVKKPTFHNHYHNIYDLSDKLETRIVEDIVYSIQNPENIFNNPDAFTKEFFYAYKSKGENVSLVFSGSRAAMLPQKTEYILKKRLFELYPDYENDVEKNVMLSFKIYGGFYALQVNKNYDADKVISIIISLNSQ